jgi:MOSC domain-containing protein YiiM
MASSGHVVAVCLSRKREDPKIDVGSGELVQGVGLVGDAHAGTEKEVSILAVERIRELCRETGLEAGPGCFAENITTEGADLTSVTIGSLIQVGETRLQVVQIGKDPALSHTYSYKGHSILPRWGVFCKVILGGRVGRGDLIAILE